MAQLSRDQTAFLNWLESSDAFQRVDKTELLTLLYALKRRHMHIPEESLACVYLEVAANLRDCLDKHKTEGTDLVLECEALLVELGSIAAALTRRQRGRPPV